MGGEFFAQGRDLFFGHWTGAVSPFAAFVGENIRDFLIAQTFPRLHDSAAVLLALHFDLALQTLEHDHRRPARTAGCEFRSGERRVLAGYPLTGCLMAGLTISREDLFSTIM